MSHVAIAVGHSCCNHDVRNNGSETMHILEKYQGKYIVMGPEAGTIHNPESAHLVDRFLVSGLLKSRATVALPWSPSCSASAASCGGTVNKMSGT